MGVIMKTFIYRIAKVADGKVGNDFLITTEDNIDVPFDEVYAICDNVHEWLAAPVVADLACGKGQKIKNASFRGLLSNLALYTPVSEQPKTYFIEKEK